MLENGFVKCSEFAWVGELYYIKIVYYYYYEEEEWDFFPYIWATS